MVTKLYCLRRAMASSEIVAESGAERPSGGQRRRLTDADVKSVLEARRLASVAPTDGAELTPQADKPKSLFAGNMEKNKFGVLGMGLWGVIVIYFLSRVRKRKIPLQNYLIQLRMFAQIACIGCIAGGAVYGSWTKEK